MKFAHFTCLLATAGLSISVAVPALAQDAPAATRTETAGPTAPFASPRIIVTVVGEGPDVVLIPGLGSSPDVWTATIAVMPGYRYHLVQVKGFAGAPGEANTSGPVVHPVAEEIVRYIRDAHLDHPALVGHSMGGTLAMTVATHHPELVGRLMVVDMFPFIGAMFGGPGATPDSVRPMAEQIRTGIATATGEARRAQTEGVINGMVRTEAMRAGALADSMNSNPAVMGQAYYDIVTTDLTPELVRFTGPFTVLWVVPAGAPVDENMMGIFYRSAYAGAPQAVVTHIPDSAHFIMHDAPARFQAELRSFLTAVPPAG